MEGSGMGSAGCGVHVGYLNQVSVIYYYKLLLPTLVLTS